MIDYKDTKDARDLPLKSVLELYHANHWSSADKPNELYQGLLGSHALVHAWDGRKLVGLGNTLSDGHLVVYYSHILVLPDYRNQGIGKLILEILMEKYRGFHQQVLLADGNAVDFFEKLGFQRAGNTAPMWIYHGNDHEKLR